MLSVYLLAGNLPGEKIIQIIRRDIFIFIKKIVYFAVLLLLPAVLFYIIFTRIYPDLLTGAVSGPLLILLISFYYLFIWMFFFFSFIDYYLDVWVITNERIVDIQQQGFFSRIVSEQRLYRIQDVTSETNGFLPTVLKYGDVYVQTAGQKQRFKFSECPNPDKIRDKIIELAERSKGRRG